MRERDKNFLADILNKTHDKRPLVHQLTNMVSAQVQADMVAILGGVSIMSDSAAEAEEIVTNSDALLINAGTPNTSSPELFRTALRVAEKRGIPIVLDPVGYGFTSLRVNLIDSLLREFRFSVIRGNSAEIAALAGEDDAPKGVSADNEPKDVRRAAEKLAKKYGCAVSASGAVDTISDGDTTLRLSGGSPLVTTLSGIGCALGSCTALYSAVAGSFDGALTASAAFRLAAERAAGQAAGSGSFYRLFQDELFLLREKELDWGDLLVQ